MLELVDRDADRRISQHVLYLIYTHSGNYLYDSFY